MKKTIIAAGATVLTILGTAAAGILEDGAIGDALLQVSTALPNSHKFLLGCLIAFLVFRSFENRRREKRDSGNTAEITKAMSAAMEQVIKNLGSTSSAENKQIITAIKDLSAQVEKLAAAIDNRK